MPMRMISLKREGTCAACGGAVPTGATALWDPGAKTVTEARCIAAALPPAPGARSTAGASARREFERRHQRREERIDVRWGKLAGAVKFLSDDPASTTVWAKGAEGEALLGAALERYMGGCGVVLHDRAIPRTRANIDHLVIAPSGVWIVDAKRYKGKIERRDVGGWLRTDERLFVNGRDRTTLIHGMAWQLDAVRVALAGEDVPIKRALCFVKGEWPLFSKPFKIGGVWVIWHKKLAEMLKAPARLDRSRIDEIGRLLAAALPSKG